MQCSDCGYQLSPFDKDCPRCKVMSMKGTKPSTTPPIELNFDHHSIDRIEKTKLKCANCSNSLECGWLACPKCGIQFEAPVPLPSSGKSEAAPLSTIAPPSKSPAGGIIAGLVMIILLGFLIVNSNKVTKGASSITSSAESKSDASTSFSDVSVTRSTPLYGGQRNWYVGITAHNNLSMPLKTYSVELYFDDFSSILLELDKLSSIKTETADGALEHALHPPGYSPPILGPGKSAEWSFSSDDFTDNVAKRPKKLIIATDQGPFEVPIPPN